VSADFNPNDPADTVVPLRWFMSPTIWVTEALRSVQERTPTADAL
jgi:hypothetical protein